MDNLLTASSEISDAQRRLWVLNQTDRTVRASLFVAAAESRERIDPDGLARSIETLTARHEALRTVFRVSEGVLIAELGAPFRPSVEVIDSGNTLDELIERARNEQGSSLDLECGPLFRVRLIRSFESDVVFLSASRMIFDDPSAEIFFAELAALYLGAELGEGPRLQPLEYFAHVRLEDADRSYWLRTLSDLPPSVSMPQIQSRPPLRVPEGDGVVFDVPLDYVNHFCETGLEESLVAAIFGLLYRYTNQRDLLMSMSVSGRLDPRLQKTIGRLEDVVAIRLNVAPDRPFCELIDQARLILEETRRHQNYPFDRLIEELGISGDGSRGDLVDIHVQFPGPHAGIDRRWRYLSEADLGFLDYDLSFDFGEIAQGQATIRYNRCLFDKSDIYRVRDHFLQWIASTATDPSREVRFQRLLTMEEQRRLLIENNHSDVAYPKGKLIPQLFEEVAAAQPDEIAVVAGAASLTYRELNRRANHLAHFLRDECSVERDGFVDVMVEGSEWLIVSLIGILKSGAAYLPIAPSYPEARIAHMLDESRSRVHICMNSEEHRFANRPGVVVVIDRDWQRIEAYDGANPGPMSEPQDLAYIIYTSGSTGRPKGVLQTHRCLANFVQWQVSDAGFEKHLRILQCAAISFDVSVQEILHALLSGAALHVIPDSLRKDLEGIKRYIIDHKIAVIDFPFSVIMVLFAYDDELERKSCLKHIISAGEPWRVTPQLRGLLTRRPDISLHNHYGPSETHMLTSHTISARLGNIVSNPPLGKPISNMKAFVLDDDLQPVPTGVIGELCISGPGVSSGYFDRELTSRKFVPHPFYPGETLYRTDDLARWLPDGHIQLLGRRDALVKIRGYRVEPGEVERALLTHSSIKECVVIARVLRNEEKELIAYIVSSRAVPPSELRRHLGEMLPDYMFPAYFMPVDAIPLSPNGKANPAALPDPPRTPPRVGAAGTAPRDRVEQELVEIWSDELLANGIGTNDNFFDWGGNSIKSLRICSRILQRLRIKTTVRDIFLSPTVAELADVLRSRRQSDSCEIPKAQHRDHYQVSNAQRRLLLFDQANERGRRAYNVLDCYLLDCAPDTKALRKATESLLDRHQILRATFVSAAGEMALRIDQNASVEISAPQGSFEPEQARQWLVEWASVPFDLSRAPLMRLAIIGTRGGETILAILLHHLIVDAWSLTVLFDDLRRMYAAWEKNIAPEIAPLTIQYWDYSDWQASTLRNDRLRPHREYWHSKLSPLPVALCLPADFTRTRRPARNGLIQYFTMPSDRLRQLCESTGSTLFVTLLAIVKILLYRYTKEQDVTVGSPMAGRCHPELENQIGFYVNTVVLRDQVREHMTAADLINDVRRTVLDAQEHESYPFELLAEEMDASPGPGRLPFFDVWVVVQEARPQSLSFGSLNATSFPIDLPISLFDLSFQFEPINGEIRGKLQFDSDVYEAATIELMVHRFTDLVLRVADDPGRSIADLIAHIGPKRTLSPKLRKIPFAFEESNI